MEIIKRERIEKQLNDRFGIEASLTIEDLKGNFEELIIDYLDFQEMLGIIQKFLKKDGTDGKIFFPDSTGWETKGIIPVEFDSVTETIEFLEKEIIYGADNYYITNSEMDWFIVICSEDLHLYGNAKFLTNFNKFLSRK